MAFPILQTKLFIPPAHHLLARIHLVQILEEGLRKNHRLFLISSTAGSGKSSLLSTWAVQHPKAVAWVSLDEGDQETARFWQYLIAALQTIKPEIGREAAELLNTPQPVPNPTILVRLLNDLTNQPDRIIIILDDYHVISNAEIHAGITFLIDYLPPHISLVISTRADPPIPIVRMRAHNWVTEIREASLRFSPEEASALFQNMGLSISSDDLQAIEKRTEGWAVGLQLVGLACKMSFAAHDQPDPHRFITAFVESDLYILEYLAEEVLSHLDPGTLDFLTKTSIVDQMRAGLCAEILQQPGEDERTCQAMLNDLARANLFTISLDPARSWYRYHHLFAELLQHRLKETHPSEEILELHRRASAWMIHNHFHEEAIRHAVLGQDFELAAGLIETLARSMMYAGRVNTLKHWLQALPEGCLENHLHLKIYDIWIDLLQGICDLSRQNIQATEQLIASLPSTPENNQLKVELMVILCRFIAISGDSPQAIQFAHQALSALPESDLASRARVQSALAIAYGLSGAIEQADAAFEECFQLARTSSYYSLMAHTSMMIALGNARYGRLRAPARFLQEVIDLGVLSGQRIFYPAGQADIGLASIYLEWNNLEEAGQLLEQGIELCRQSGLDGVFSGYVLRARLLQAKGDLTGALEAIQSVENSFQRKDQDTTDRQVQTLLALGKVAVAAQFIDPITAMIDANAKTQRIPSLFLEGLKITLARIWLAQGALDQVCALLDEIQAEAEQGKRIGHLIAIYTLQAMALWSRQREQHSKTALDRFQHALELAEPEGFTLLFLEMGQGILPLLQAIVHDSSATQPVKRHASLVLAAATPKPPRNPEHPPRPAIAETGFDYGLSQREMEILRLIDAGCTNQEIAERLFITLHTVKKHGSHIFAKLNVASRTQAVARARQAGLL